MPDRNLQLGKLSAIKGNYTRFSYQGPAQRSKVKCICAKMSASYVYFPTLLTANLTPAEMILLEVLPPEGLRSNNGLILQHL